MCYTNCITLTTALELDLFENIEYKYLKKLLNIGVDASIDYDEYDFEVEIENIPDDTIEAWECCTRITFEIEDKKYEKLYTYNNSSITALQFANLYEEIESEDFDEYCDEEKNHY